MLHISKEVMMHISERKLRKIIRQEIMNEGVKSFLKGAIYNDYEIAIQEIIASGNYINAGSLYLVPATEVSKSNVRIREDELYSDENDNACVIIINEKTPLIGLSLITNYDFFKNENKYKEKIKDFINQNNLKPLK